MKPKSDLDLAVAAALKTARTAIRLRYSLLADAEINDRLPELESEILAAAVAGKPYTANLAELFGS